MKNILLLIYKRGTEFYKSKSCFCMASAYLSIHKPFHSKFFNHGDKNAKMDCYRDFRVRTY